MSTTRVSINQFVNSVVSQEANIASAERPEHGPGELQHETTVQEVDNNSSSIKALMNETIEQADGVTGSDGSDEVVVENDNDDELATSME